MAHAKDGPVNERGEDRDEQLEVEAARRSRRDGGAWAPLPFTEDERATLTNALYTAAGKFEEIAKAASAPHVEDRPHREARHRLAEQFEKQAREARELAKKIEEAE